MTNMIGKRTILVVSIISLLTIRPAIPASLGPNNPINTSGKNWTNPVLVCISDNLRAVYNYSQQDRLAATSFGFTAPAGSIDGIKVEIESYGVGTPPPSGNQIDVALSKSGTSPTGNWKTAIALPYGSGSETYIICGDSTDLWGTTWDSSEIAASYFGVLIRDYDTTASSLYIDHVRITVYYTPSTIPARRIKIQTDLMGE